MLFLHRERGDRSVRDVCVVTDSVASVPLSTEAMLASSTEAGFFSVMFRIECGGDPGDSRQVCDVPARCSCSSAALECQMRVLLVYPDAREEIIGWGDLGAVAEPLALEYLGAGAQLDGHVVKILDLRFHVDDFDDVVKSFAPEVIGVTGYSMHVLRMLSICRRAKELGPGIWTVVGGHHATLLPVDFFEPEIDFVVQGEGVGPFRKLLRALESQTPADEIAGLQFRKNGQFVSGGVPEPFEIDQIPLPDRSLTQTDRDRYFIDWMKPIALMRNTVGCPYRCSFCSLWRIMDGRYYKRELDRIIDELASIPEEFVFFVDDEAFVDGSRMLELAEAIHESGIRKRYFTYCRFDTLLRQPKLMKRWREVGLERLFVGIEAVTAMELKDYNKRLQVAELEQGFRAARDLEISIFAGFIVHPKYMPRDFERLVRFIEHNRVEYPSFTIWTPLPGTELPNGFDTVIERQPNGRPNWELFDLQHPVIRTLLPREKFMNEYRNLHRVFAGRYTPFRDIGAALRRRGGEVESTVSTTTGEIGVG